MDPEVLRLPPHLRPSPDLVGGVPPAPPPVGGNAKAQAVERLRKRATATTASHRGVPDPLEQTMYGPLGAAPGQIEAEDAADARARAARGSF